MMSWSAWSLQAFDEETHRFEIRSVRELTAAGHGFTRPARLRCTALHRIRSRNLAAPALVVESRSFPAIHASVAFAASQCALTHAFAVSSIA